MWDRLTAALPVANRVLPWGATETLLPDDKTRRHRQEMCDRLVAGGARAPALRQDLHAALHHVIKQKTLAADLGAAWLTAVLGALLSRSRRTSGAPEERERVPSWMDA